MKPALNSPAPGTDTFCCFRSSASGAPRALWEINTACNLRCDFCHAIPNADPGIAREEVVEGLRILRRWGVEDVIFSGGEPFVRSDMLPILDDARRLGFGVDVCTNGTLVTAVMARDLGRLLSEISVSLDAPDARRHDRLRGQPGAFQKTLLGIEMLVAAGLDVHAIAMISDVTSAYVHETVRVLRDLKVHSVTLLGLMPYPPRAAAPGTDRRLRLMHPETASGHRLSPHVRAGLQTALGAIRAESPGFPVNTKCLVPGGPPCGAGRSILGIDCRGHLLPCILLKGMPGTRRLVEYTGDVIPSGVMRFAWQGRHYDMERHDGSCVAYEV